MNPSLQVSHPFTQEALDTPPIRITKAEAVYLYTEDGRRLIDGISSWWVNLHGHGHPDIVSAIATQFACQIVSSSLSSERARAVGVNLFSRTNRLRTVQRRDLPPSCERS